MFIPIIWQASRWREGKVAGDSDRGNSESAGYIEGGVQYSTVQYSTVCTILHWLEWHTHTSSVVRLGIPYKYTVYSATWGIWCPQLESSFTLKLLRPWKPKSGPYFGSWRSFKVKEDCVRLHQIPHIALWHSSYIHHTTVAHIERHSPCIHPTQILHHRPLLDCFKLSQIKAFTKTYGTGMNSLG